MFSSPQVHHPNHQPPPAEVPSLGFPLSPSSPFAGRVKDTNKVGIPAYKTIFFGPFPYCNQIYIVIFGITKNGASNDIFFIFLSPSKNTEQLGISYDWTVIQKFRRRLTRCCCWKRGGRERGGEEERGCSQRQKDVEGREVKRPRRYSDWGRKREESRYDWVFWCYHGENKCEHRERTLPVTWPWSWAREFEWALLHDYVTRSVSASVWVLSGYLQFSQQLQEWQNPWMIY